MSLGDSNHPLALSIELGPVPLSRGHRRIRFVKGNVALCIRGVCPIAGKMTRDEMDWAVRGSNRNWSRFVLRFTPSARKTLTFRYQGRVAVDGILNHNPRMFAARSNVSPPMREAPVCSRIATASADTLAMMNSMLLVGASAFLLSGTEKKNTNLS